MLNRSQKPCSRDACDYRAVRKKLCGVHYLEEFPPKPRALPQPKPRKPLKARPRAGKRRAKGDVPAAVRAVVLERCGGLCEACGGVLVGGVHLHHRLRRRDGGHTADNLVALHPCCHVVAPEAVHQRPTWAKTRGLIVASWADPAETTVTLASGRVVLLHRTAPVYVSPLSYVAPSAA